MKTPAPPLLKAAKWYASNGWLIFPVTPNGKAPLIKNGHHGASCDADTAATWWQRWPTANIGLYCGASGFIAIDGDPAHYEDGSAEFLDDLLKEFPTTAQSTPTTGAHLIYLMPDGLEPSNRRGDLPPGIDVRCAGYILLTPSTVTYRGDDANVKGVPDGHVGEYAWMPGLKPTDLQPQPLPPKVVELLTRKRDGSPLGAAQPLPSTPAAPHTNGASNYARAALLKELDELARASIGNRNNQLNDSAFALGQLVGGGELNESEVTNQLMACAIGIKLDEREAERTIRSGLTAGMKSPRNAPPVPKIVFHRNGHGAANGDALKDAPSEDAVELNVFRYRAEDGGILDAWVELCADEWLYVTDRDKWFSWSLTHWQRDDLLLLHWQVETMMDAMNAQAREALATAKQELMAAKADGDSDKEAKAKEKADGAKAYISATKRTKARVGSVEGMARPKRPAVTADMDMGNLLNLRNGTLNLDTLQLREHDRADKLTYCLPYEYDYTAGCARFRQFIREVLVKDDRITPDPDLAALAQELVGYSLTSDTKHEVMAWLSGEGGNGKTVMISVLGLLLGPLAIKVDFQSIGLPGNYDLASLPGKRIVFSTESERGGQMAEGYIKSIVSGETINARPIYGDPFEFRSTAKLWWAMNDKPTVKDTSNALWRRLKLIPFHRTFRGAERDTELISKLTLELPGILNWAIEGLARLRKQGGFTEAAAMSAAIDEFKYESNPVAQWLKERTEPGGETLATAVFQNYALWCTRSNNKELTSTAFGRELARLGVPKEHKRTGWVYRLSLLQPDNM